MSEKAECLLAIGEDQKSKLFGVTLSIESRHYRGSLTACLSSLPTSASSTAVRIE